MVECEVLDRSRFSSRPSRLRLFACSAEAACPCLPVVCACAVPMKDVGEDWDGPRGDAAWVAGVSQPAVAVAVSWKWQSVS